MSSSWIVRSVLLVAGLLLATSGALVVNNPSISGTSEGDYTCFAPYDIVINGEDNLVGMRPDGLDIAARCREAGRDRFWVAAGLGGSGVLIAIIGGALAARTRKFTGGR